MVKVLPCVLLVVLFMVVAGASTAAGPEILFTVSAVILAIVLLHFAYCQVSVSVLWALKAGGKRGCLSRTLPTVRRGN